MDVADLIASPESAERVIRRVVQQAETHLQSGKDTLVMTSRKLVTGRDELDSLAIGARVAEALVKVLQQIQVRPRYIIAKVGNRALRSENPSADQLAVAVGRHHFFRRCDQGA